jgi:hypothetical protein
VNRKEKGMENNEKKSDQPIPGQNRRELLKTVGAALIAGSIPAVGAEEIEAQERPKKPRVFTVPAATKTALQKISPDPEGKEISVFFAHPRGSKIASVVPLLASDSEAVAALSKELHGSPARATISGGIIHVNLGQAAEGRCTLSGLGGVAAFKPDPGPVEKGTIYRETR